MSNPQIVPVTRPVPGHVGGLASRLISPRNVGKADRVARVIAGAAMVAAPLTLGASLAVLAPVGLLAGATVMSGALGRCSVYHALGVSTLDAPTSH